MNSNTNQNEMAVKENLAVRRTYITINFKSLFMEILDKLFVILLCGVLTGLVSYAVYAYVVKPNYVSSTKIYVLPQKSDEALNYQELEAGQQLTNDYIEVIQGRTVVEDTIEFFNLDERYEKFCKKLTVENQSDTRILSISIKDKDPVMARSITTKLSEYAKQSIEHGMGIKADDITTIEEANLPIVPEYPPIVIAIICALGAIALVIVIVCAHYIIIDRIVTADDVEERLGLPVLGSIMLEKKSRMK